MILGARILGTLVNPNIHTRDFEKDHTSTTKRLLTKPSTQLPRILPASQFDMSAKQEQPVTKSFGKGERSIPHHSQKANKYYPAEDESVPKKVRLTQ
jgi:hypothetical protein